MKGISLRNGDLRLPFTFYITRFNRGWKDTLGLGPCASITSLSFAILALDVAHNLQRVELELGIKDDISPEYRFSQTVDEMDARKV